MGKEARGIAMKTIIVLTAIILLYATPGFTQTTQTASFNLSWIDNSNNETGFNIERALGPTGTFAQIASVNANVVNYQDVIKTDPGNTTYCYRANAFNAAGKSANSTVACGTTPTIILAPNAPGGITVTVTVTIP